MEIKNILKALTNCLLIITLTILTIIEGKLTSRSHETKADYKIFYRGYYR